MNEYGLIERLDTAESLAIFLRCSTAKIRKDTMRKQLPIIKVGRAVRYDRRAVLEFLRRDEETNIRL